MQNRGVVTKVVVFEYAPRRFYLGDLATKWNANAAGYRLVEATGEIISKTGIYPTLLAHSNGTTITNKASYFMQGKGSYLPLLQPTEIMTKARWKEVILVGSNIHFSTDLRCLEASVVGRTPWGEKAVYNLVSGGDIVNKLIQGMGAESLLGSAGDLLVKLIDKPTPTGVLALGNKRNIDMGNDIRHTEWFTPNLFSRYKEKLPPSSSPSNPESIKSIKESFGGIDFSSIQLDYIAGYPELSTFKYVIKAQKAGKDNKVIDIADASQLSLNALFIGLAVPNHKFWVNLNKWEPKRIVDESVGKTDVGKILLEADLRLKKDSCRLTDPRNSDIGRIYWNRLQAKTHATTNKNNQIVAMTRFWIVPGEVLVYENDNEVYIHKATLNVCLESEYFASRGEDNSRLSQQISQEMQEYSAKLTKELILPHLIHEINYSDNYADLRQVFHSIILAQWYKEKFRYRDGLFSELIDTGDVSEFKSRQPWNGKEIWERFVHSFDHGEYSFEETSTERKGNCIITHSTCYFSGGVDFTNIKITTLGDLVPKIKALIVEAIYTPVGSYINNNYFFGDIHILDKDSYERGGGGDHGGSGGGDDDGDRNEGHGHPHGHGHGHGTESANSEDNDQQTEILALLIILGTASFLIIGITAFLLTRKPTTKTNYTDYPSDDDFIY
ncbi:hypothetical protein KKE26_04310 [bacterium]|nr:hypothetical protein [bacterium]